MRKISNDFEQYDVGLEHSLSLRQKGVVFQAQTEWIVQSPPNFVAIFVNVSSSLYVQECNYSPVGAIVSDQPANKAKTR